MKELTIERSIWIEAPIERAWRAITEAAQLEQWFAPGCRWEIEALQIGATVKFYNTPDDIALHTIAVLDSARQFALRWFEQENMPMLTTFLLSEENNGTRVTVIESGFEQMADGMRQKRVSQTEAGYSDSLNNLKVHLEGGSITQ